MAAITLLPYQTFNDTSGRARNPHNEDILEVYTAGANGYVVLKSTLQEDRTNQAENAYVIPVSTADAATILTAWQTYHTSKATLANQVSAAALQQAGLGQGRLSLSVAGAANVTLSAVQYANGILEFTGLLTGAIQVILPLVDSREWQVANLTTGAFTLTVIGASGAGVAITQTKRCLVYTDGVNFYKGAAEV